MVWVRLGRLGAGLAVALACAGLAAGAQAQLLAQPPPELWQETPAGTPAGDAADQYAPEDPGPAYGIDAEVAASLDTPNQLLQTIGGFGLGAPSQVLGRTVPPSSSVAVPTAKPTDVWQLKAGARFGATETIADSATGFDVDLHTVRFRSPREGIAAGSACAVEPEPFQESQESKADYLKRVGECRDRDETAVGPRVPVLYNYLDSPDKGLHWEEVYRGSVKLDPDNPALGGPGFVGAVEWIGFGRALAVGGTGIYPRRELRWNEKDQYGRYNDCRAGEAAHPPSVEDCTPANPLKADVAGAGRAWLYEDGEWSEIDLSAQRGQDIAATPASEARLGPGDLYVPDATSPEFQQKATNPTPLFPLTCAFVITPPEGNPGNPTPPAQQCPKQRVEGEKLATVTAPEPISEFARATPRAGIRGMTALAISPNELMRETKGELGFAGALGQIWRWRSDPGRPDTGRFDKVYDARSPDPKSVPSMPRGTWTPGGYSGHSSGAEVRDAASLRFRVRELRPRVQDKFPDIRAFLGVTGGCCMPEETAGRSMENLPKLLGFADGRYGLGYEGAGAPEQQPNVWYVNSIHYDPTEHPEGGVNPSGCGCGLDGPAHAYTPAKLKRVNPRQEVPDSVYSFGFSQRGDGARGTGGVPPMVSLVRAPGGATPTRGREAPSTVGPPFAISRQGAPSSQLDVPSTQYHDQFNLNLSSARLLGADGDTDGYGTPPNRVSYARPDWAVGVLRAKGQGLTVSTHMQMRPSHYSAVENICNDDLANNFLAWPGCELQNLSGLSPPQFNQNRFDDSFKSRYLLTDSYTLNAIDMDDESGGGWAVGDYGAILELSGTAAQKLFAAGEPEPIELRPKGRKTLADRGPYERFKPRTPPGGAGDVPALVERPGKRLPKAEPRFAGAPDPERGEGEYREGVTEIVMAPDGSEGWAIGPFERRPYGAPNDLNTGGIGQATVYRFDGERWSSCDAVGIPGRMEPDPACASLRRLFDYHPVSEGFGGATQVSPTVSPVKLVAAARVPYESDIDPTNDDEFEVVAIGTQYRASERDPLRCAILRYRKGRWAHEEARAAVGGSGGFSEDACAISTQSQPSPADLRDIAFAAPDDGWILGSRSLYRFDGEGWHDCALAANQDRCGDPDLDPAKAGHQGRLPVFRAGESVSNLTAGLASAGGRVYLYGRRQGGSTPSAPSSYPDYLPMILSREGGGAWRSEYDPAFGRDPQAPSDPTVLALEGRIFNLAVAKSKDGGYSGWAVGGPGDARLMRFKGGAWKVWEHADASREIDAGQASRIAVLADPPPGTPAALVSYRTPLVIYPALAFDPESERWVKDPSLPEGRALAPDGRGGYWLASGTDIHFARLSASQPKEVFEEVRNPVAPHERLTTLAAQPDGTLWAGTNIGGALYRYERTTGWERLVVPGWQIGKVVLPAAANAIAVNESGVGIAVGREGRIADIEPAGVSLDAASGTLCDLAKVATPDLTVPCGSSRTLRAAAVAPDGSALAGGDYLALLWRPAGGQFRAVERPAAASSSRITGISMPTSERAFLVNDRGLVFAGWRGREGRNCDEQGAGTSWCWRMESTDAKNRQISFDARNRPQALHAIAVRADGSGWAVGARGLVLERTGDGAYPWRRVKSDLGGHLRSIALDPSGGPGALVGADSGQVLSLKEGRLLVSRAAVPQADDGISDGVPGFSTGEEQEDGDEHTPAIKAVAILPGVREGQTEAWALSAGFPGRNGTSRLYHYASDPGESLLDPGREGAALADSPPAQPGELALAAFGRPRLDQGHLGLREAVSARVVAEIAERAKRPGGPRATIFTGDVAGHGLVGAELAEGLEVSTGSTDTRSLVGSDQPARFADFNRRVAEPLDRAGAPLFAAVGNRDLEEVREPFRNTKTYTGDTFAWRRAMAGRPWPRGRSETLFPHKDAQSALRFRALAHPPLALRHEDRKLERVQSPNLFPEGGNFSAITPAAGADLATGGASTHYAVDVLDGPRAIARLVFLDNSNRSLALSDPLQQPLEPNRGQAGFLEYALCHRGQSVALGRCTRSPGQRAIVVATTPTYAYAPSQSSADLAQDYATFETLLMRYGADLVVSGRLGYNSRYWATAPGLHEPCPGEPYRDTPPTPGRRSCGGRGVESDPSGLAAETLASALGGGAADAVGEKQSFAGLLPFAIASNAGGDIPEGEAKDGFWRGYTILRLHPSGDPGKTVIEQRPVHAWARIDAAAFVLRPGQRMSLRGMARAPLTPESVGFNTQATAAADFDRIESPAISHRYVLVEADPERPWLARQAPGDGDSATGPYVPLDPSIATVDPQSGIVRVGKGSRERAYAVAVLSLGCSGTDAGENGACDPDLPGVHVASYPLVFEPRRSFVPRPVPAPPPVPKPVQIQAAAPQPPAPSPPPNFPGTTPISLPNPPALTPPPPPANPPQIRLPNLTVPPAPPVPPPGLPIQVTPTAVSVAILPLPGVFPQPAPPIQPAPPSGARREARQRQAATEKSGSDSGANTESTQVDMADAPTGPPGSAFARRDRTKPEPSFTALERQDQPSAWARGALYGGGLTLAALALAGFITPRPRPRPPAAPAWARVERRER